MKNIYVLLLVLLCAVCLAGCTNPAFTGKLEAHGDRFYLVYSKLSGTQAHQLVLQEGMIIDVTIERVAGHIDIYVTDSRDAVLYQGNDADSSQFVLVVPRTDTYLFTVTGNKAKGSVLFQVRK
jgi:hypothetical protein